MMCPHTELTMIPCLWPLNRRENTDFIGVHVFGGLLWYTSLWW